MITLKLCLIHKNQLLYLDAYRLTITQTFQRIESGKYIA